MLLTRFFTSYLNQFGTYILFGVIFVISLITAFDISLVLLVKKIVAVAGYVVEAARSFLMIRVERSRRKKATQHKKITISAGAPRIDEKVSAEVGSRPLKIEQVAFEFAGEGADFALPSLTLLDDVETKDLRIDRESLLMNARLLEKKLSDFGVEGKVVEVRPGPVITMYELEPAAGVKITRITNLADDLALAMKAQGVRIVGPIPGKSVIGIEIPNQVRASVHIRDVLDNDEFRDPKYRLAMGLGKDIVGMPVVADLAKMPHLLIAGTTGSGKSVSLNAMICSILFRATPADVKFLMIDPKRIELSSYEGIPHLLHPVVVNPKKASQVLKWAVDEMERRYRAISALGVKSIDRYNKLLEKRGRTREESDIPQPVPPSDEAPITHEKLPYIIIVIDELADLIMVAQRNVEESLTRLAQMARAAGIHLILATQRPSVDVITGIIKANFPIRISFQVSSKVDSRTILDHLGAEKLLGNGDMLFIPPGVSKLMRIHGAFVSDKEIERITDFVRKQGAPSYDESLSQYSVEAKEGDTADEEYDERYDEAVQLVTDLGQASISLVQRYLKVGYNRAARMIEKMEAEGVVGPSDGAKPRKVLANKLPE
jgi:S-DNA-T family DNA segregation ATPase FtsK/SpoIIIE